MVTCHMYPEKFIRGNVISPFLQLCIVTVLFPISEMVLTTSRLSRHSINPINKTHKIQTATPDLSPLSTFCHDTKVGGLNLQLPITSVINNVYSGDKGE